MMLSKRIGSMRFALGLGVAMSACTTYDNLDLNPGARASEMTDPAGGGGQVAASYVGAGVQSSGGSGAFSTAGTSALSGSAGAMSSTGGLSASGGLSGTGSSAAGGLGAVAAVSGGDSGGPPSDGGSGESGAAGSGSAPASPPTCTATEVLCGDVCIVGDVCPGPCDGICSNPTVMNQPGNSGSLGTGASCFELMFDLGGGSCGNFAPGRALYLNSQDVACDGSNWPKPPPKQAGGYCVQVSAGRQSYAYFQTW